MSQFRIDQEQSRSNDDAVTTPHTRVSQSRAPLISRLIDPSNVVFSLVFCQQTRREFEVRQAG